MIIIFLSIFGVMGVIVFGVFTIVHSGLSNDTKIIYPEVVFVGRFIGAVLTLLCLLIIILAFFLDEKMFQATPPKPNHDAIYY